jgi:hypothetical protein
MRQDVCFVTKELPQKNKIWSIGICAGKSPFDLASLAGVLNPVLTCQHVSDVPAKFVADPFMIQADGAWYMFFEVLNQQTNKGEIGLATSETGHRWVYHQIVLSEPFHLSYPYVFESNGDYYMTPETLRAGSVRLYKATDFPRRWTFLTSLISGSCADPSVFQYDGRWWMFTCSTPYQHDTLRLYLADEIMGEWREHPASPIVTGDRRKARPGGRVLVLDNSIIRFAQDCFPAYGTQLRAFEVTELTPSTYVEKESSKSPVLSANGQGWNRTGMHHVDAHLLKDGRWLACVDGSWEKSHPPDQNHHASAALVQA